MYQMSVELYSQRISDCIDSGLPPCPPTAPSIPSAPPLTLTQCLFECANRRSCQVSFSPSLHFICCAYSHGPLNSVCMCVWCWWGVDDRKIQVVRLRWGKWQLVFAFGGKVMLLTIIALSLFRLFFCLFCSPCGLLWVSVVAIVLITLYTMVYRYDIYFISVWWNFRLYWRKCL